MFLSSFPGCCHHGAGERGCSGEEETSETHKPPERSSPSVPVVSLALTPVASRTAQKPLHP